MQSQAPDLDPFERERPMTLEEVWTYLGVCRADFFKLKNPKAPEHDPLLPKPDRLFGTRLTMKKGEVFDYLVARRAAARAGATIGEELGSARRSIDRSGRVRDQSNNSTRARKAAGTPISPVQTPKSASLNDDDALASGGSIIYSELGAAHA